MAAQGATAGGIPHTGWRPEREIELVAGTPAGGGQDRPARVLINLLAALRLVEVPIRLTNIPGRGGGNGWDYLARNAGDPHVLAILSPTIVSNRLLGVSTLDALALTPLALLYSECTAFVVRADSPIRTGGDLLQRLGRDAGGVPVALATALGNANHIALARVTQHAGGDVRALQITTFDSARFAVAALLEGKAELATITAVSAAPELEAGKVRVLAVSSPQRLGGAFGSVPTWTEQSVDCVVGMWRGVIGAGGLPPGAAAFWNAALGTAARSAEWRAELQRQYWADAYLDSAACRDFLAREFHDTAAALRSIGLLSPAASGEART